MVLSLSNLTPVRAVEFQIALPDDEYRREQLLLSLADKASPANKFSWGNLITLRDQVTEDELYTKLHAFRKRHYSSHRMKLAIQVGYKNIATWALDKR